MKRNIVIFGIICVLIILIIWVLAGQNGANKPEPEQTMQENESSANGIEAQVIELPPCKLPVNEDGLIEVIIPQNLFGGKSVTAEQYVDQYYDYYEDSTNQQRSIKVIANNDGTVTETYTPEQLEQFRQNIYSYTQYNRNFSLDSIKEVVLGNSIFTEITVLVDTEQYQKNSFERQMANSALAIYAGMFQILTGIPADEWHTTITIEDISTREIVSKTDFPNENMYRVY